MNTAARRSGRKYAALAAGALAFAGGVVGLGAGTAGATYLDCSGDQVFDIPGFRGVELYDVADYDVRIFDLPFTLTAGTYDVETSSFDGYIGRAEVPEAEQERSERWFAEFLDADGNQVGGFDGATTDLPDDTDVAELKDDFTVALDGDATQVRLVLVKDFESLNLVHVGCLGFSRWPDPTTTTATPTTVAPTTVVPTTPTSQPPTTQVPVTEAPKVDPTTASTVTPFVQEVTTARLPVTGSNTVPLAAAGTGLIALGAAMVRRFNPGAA